MLPLSADLIAYITNLRSTRLAASVQSQLQHAGGILPKLWLRGNVPRRMRIGFVVHKLSGLLAGLLRHLLASRLPAGAGRPSASSNSTTRRDLQHRRPPSFVLFAWERLADAEVDRAARVGTRARGQGLEDGELQLASDGMDEIVGLQGLEVCERGETRREAWR